MCGRWMVLALALVALQTSCATTSCNNSTERLFGLVTVYRFRNEACTGGSGDVGTCYPRFNCVMGGGSMEGACAKGLATCCVRKVGCGGTSTLNNTYLVSPAYPATFNYATQCSQKIRLIDDTICQLRLDVTEVTLAGPDKHGNCLADKLTFSQDSKWTQVCGTTKDTHYYLDVDYSTASVVEFFFNIAPDDVERRWKIRVSQISCGGHYEVPEGCGQYFTSATGTLKGWNADGAPGQYLHGQNYAVCLRKELNHCSTTYSVDNINWFVSQCSDTFEYPFLFGPTQATSNPCSTNPIAHTPITVSHQGPHIFYLVSGDASNDHTDTRIINLNINIQFTQNVC